ncbi:MAG: T9SS type A sorting domain-containing protein [Candidatus Delongbacteria bacterium]|nr:T9SS type A sorting domain-containing protein [Candidatus Delongbacteria bacterium]MBN2834876.1 T9SS type A sorting domain-containing protein [Candidatus Delongbacteria bacterium]
MSDLDSWEALNGSSWRTRFNPNLTYNLTKGQELEQFASSLFGVVAYPTAVLIGYDYKVRHLDAAWPVSILAGNLDAAIAEMPVSIDDKQIETFSLFQNYPNPFNPTTTIQFSLPSDAVVQISVFDISGKTIFEKNINSSSGLNSFDFDGSNLASGQYFYKIETEGFSKIQKMILIK